MTHRPTYVRSTLLVLLIAMSLAACGDDDDNGTQTGLEPDASTADTGGNNHAEDADAVDTRRDVGEELDTGGEDAGGEDTGSEDAGSEDTGSEDTGSEDAGSEVAGSEDTGGEDAGSEDTGGDPDADAGEPADECAFTPDPSLANGEPAELSGMTETHNKWRERVGVDRLSWNTTLAASAQAYAEECIWEHSADRSPDAGYNSVGENLAFTTQQPSTSVAVDSVERWVDERYDWDFGMNIGDGNFSDYGHYTQVVWHSTAEVGCGAAYCSDIEGLSNAGTIVVCRYGPAGNYTGQAPYSESTGACLDLDNDDVLQADDADDTDRSVQ
ncbi:MAG: CAP domain-containing protein [Persicimonas sp.]